MNGVPCLLLFTKPARPGKVKTRLVGAGLSAEQAAALHEAFLGDLCERLAGARGFALRLAWALEDGEVVPAGRGPATVQQGADLGERLFRALSEAAAEYLLVGAVGSDHPELSPARVEEAFAALAGADVAIGPAHDGGYYLIALRREALSPRLFAEVPWSTGEVLSTTLARCAELGLAVALLPPEADVDTPADLVRLAASIAESRGPSCPRTRALLQDWGMLRPAVAAVASS
ncbi:MAG TPA: TIGR04282 family arsenosugar biosynthesis glycosyltransferase [Thermoanaerobaculia bacterium]|nr:TIGR04282 family arsenosugar biosynthesis glycosyltransferase [Thermoanaerobaculia bacterium]